MIQIHGVITDPAGKPVPGALIELRAISTTSEVLMGSAMTFKCDREGGYRFQLAVGTYDVYAQNDQCGDMDYMGSGVVTAKSTDGPLNSILVDSGISLTPPLLDRAVEAMQRSEAAAEATAEDRRQTSSDAMTAEQARLGATEQAAAASASATTAGSKAGDAATSAGAAAGLRVMPRSGQRTLWMWRWFLVSILLCITRPKRMPQHRDLQQAQRRPLSAPVPHRPRLHTPTPVPSPRRPRPVRRPPVQAWRPLKRALPTLPKSRRKPPPPMPVLTPVMPRKRHWSQRVRR
ncbi:carboxypeptidase-like regulatory domain-containing protein [Aeromonas hydrophila]